MIAYTLLSVVVIGLISLWIKRRSDRAQSIITRWASSKGYELVDKEYRFLAKGPFWFPPRGLHMVYRVTVRDDQGKLHNAWIQIGTWMFGLLFSDENDIKIEWE